MECIDESMDESMLESSVSLHDDYDGSSTSGSTNTGQSVPRKLEWKQSKAVQHSKILVFVGILFAAVVGVVTAGILVRRQEIDEFDMQVRLPWCGHAL